MTVPMGPAVTKLTIYRCQAINPRTLHPCQSVLIEAWAPAGALVRRRCKRCGTWQNVYVRPESEHGLLD